MDNKAKGEILSTALWMLLGGFGAGIGFEVYIGGAGVQEDVALIILGGITFCVVLLV